jgi:hypothetical protein
VLTLWRCQKPSLYERLAGTAGVEPAFAGFEDSLAHPQVNENRPEGLSLGRLPASVSWRLHGNHSADQGSLKLRDRVHAPGSLRRLQCRHTSMVGRLPAAGNWIYRRMVNPGSGRHRDAVRTPHSHSHSPPPGPPTPGRPTPTPGRPTPAARRPTPATRRPAAGVRRRGRWWMRQPAPQSVHVAATTPCREARTGPAAGRPGPSTVTGHCLEKTERFNTPPAPVFHELRQVTCGWFVHKPVDNQCEVRITIRVPWATCGRRKNSK